MKMRHRVSHTQNFADDQLRNQKIAPRIRLAAHQDPIVYAALTAYLDGAISYEQALEGMVEALVLANRALTENALKLPALQPKVLEGGK
jgi:hypothetical protein